jgi:hypothetical protein
MSEGGCANRTKDQRGQVKGGYLGLLSEGQRGTDVLATQLDSQSTLQLSKNLLVGNSSSSFIIVDLVVQIDKNLW